MFEKPVSRHKERVIGSGMNLPPSVHLGPPSSLAYNDDVQLPRRSDGVECRAFRRFGRWAFSRNAPQSGVWTCPETPQRIWAGIIVACGIRGVSGRRAPWRPGCNCKKRTPFHTPYKARRCCSYPPDRRGRRLGWYPHFHGRYTQKPIGKEKTRKKAMGFAGGGAGSHDSGVRRMDDYRGTYETVVLIEKPVRRPAFDFT